VLAFIVRRLLWAVLLVVVITLITFVIFLILPEERRSGSSRQGLVTPNLQTQFDLKGRSLPGQYVHFLGRVVLHGDLGRSLRQPISVRHIIGRGLPVTASLVIGGTLLWLLLAFPIGILSALRPRSLLDKGLMTFVLIGVSAHPVWLGLMFSYFLGLRLHAFPIAGYCDLAYDPSSPSLCGGPRYWAYHMVLPWITFALLFAALYARMIRASMLETLGEDYVRTARAKGAGTWRVLQRHVLRTTLLPVVTMVGMDMGLAFGGTLFIETVYQLPGLGQEMYRALTTADLPVIMGVVLVVSVAVTIANLIADILYCAIDPRVRLHGRRERGSSGVLRWRLRAQPRIKESPT
jgi:peptide/nickel transport system permease protein